MPLPKPTLSSLQRVADFAATTKLGRLMKSPLLFPYAAVFRTFIYSRTNRPIIRKARLFYGGELWVPLPASTDIFIGGGKTHDSEIRLAAYMIRTLQPGQAVLDIGAHCGYFSRLAADLVGAKGRVFSFEPSDLAHSVLARNAENYSQQKIFKQVLSDAPGEMTFYEFPGKFAEYSTMDVAQFEQEAWYAQNPPKVHRMQATSIDQLIKEQGVAFDFIKIDAEGAEGKVIAGGKDFFRAQAPSVAVEYLSDDRGNDGHRQAAALLQSWGYAAYLPDETGRLFPVADIAKYLAEKGLESDNVIFKKAGASDAR